MAHTVRAAVLALSRDPRPSGCRQASGCPGVRRIRVGDYRVVYSMDDGGLVVPALRIAHRREVYREF
ncbi:type II toxin-antitoxin system RelE family toxin [Thermobifida cellulosilytica]|uniref:Plasmid stabilization protein n=1 Tax=Thermobifida cellulosilytica TB100 TaxID=665004 RepID=A0A147KEH9_THECS|nr:type II toxin-antitoxin system RelE/ParE family toxin [Thermobifida cellulosilytica]KUP95670.1 hypothetical protein AC529_16290 [Thermobifida cellulosilytica TB100]